MALCSIGESTKAKKVLILYRLVMGVNVSNLPLSWNRPATLGKKALGSKACSRCVALPQMLCLRGQQTSCNSSPSSKFAHAHVLSQVTKRPEIHSRNFHFAFHAPDCSSEERNVGLGYIIPWPLPTPEGWNAKNGTMVVLPIEEDDASLSARGDLRQQLKQQLQDIQPSLLLFLNKLKRIEMREEDAPQQRLCREMSKKIIKRQGDDHKSMAHVVELDDALTRAQMTTRQTTQWLVVERTFRKEMYQSSRPDIGHTKLSIAIPLVFLRDGQVPELRDVHAFLPLRSYGFRFILQGDFDVPSSREAVDATSAWNHWLSERVPDLFLEAMMSLVKMSAEAANGMNQDGSSRVQFKAKTLGTESEVEEEEENDEDDDTSEDEGNGDLNEISLMAIAFSMIPLPQQANDFFKNIPNAILVLLRDAEIIPTQLREKPKTAKTRSDDDSVMDDSCKKLLFVRPTSAVKRPNSERKIDAVQREVDAYTEILLHRRGYHFVHPRVTLPAGIRASSEPNPEP